MYKGTYTLIIKYVSGQCNVSYFEILTDNQLDSLLGLAYSIITTSNACNGAVSMVMVENYYDRWYYYKDGSWEKTHK